MPLRPTLFGARALLFYAVVLGAYFATPYVNLFFLLLGFLTLQWLLALPWTVRNLTRVDASAPRDAVTVTAGEAASFGATLTCARGRAFDVTLAATLRREGTGAASETAGRAVGRVDVLRGEARVDVETPPLPRGVWRVVDAHVTSTYPFGLLRRARPADVELEVVAHPAPSSLAESGGRTAQDLHAELSGDAVRGAGDLQPSSLRDHREGESLRGVHWRSSARRGRLVVQEWEGGGGEGLEVVLDRRASEDDLEEALSDLAALVALAREGKEVLAVHSQGFSETFGEGHAPWSDALRFLAEARALPASGPAPPTVGPSVPRLPRTRGEGRVDAA